MDLFKVQLEASLNEWWWVLAVIIGLILVGKFVGFFLKIYFYERALRHDDFTVCPHCGSFGVKHK